MLHIVEIVLANFELDNRVRQMRSWLDRVRSEPIAFRYLSRAGVTICRVDFAIEREATAFAQSFDGCLLSVAAA